MAKRLFLSPHNDDETLFGFYTILRYKPKVLICTDSYIQGDRNTGITARERCFETQEAMRLAEADVDSLGIPDRSLTEENLEEALQKHLDYDMVFAPYLEEGGNEHHNIVSKVATRLYKNIIYYRTYNKEQFRTKGNIEIIPTEEERQLKTKALGKYKTQIDYIHTKPYFLAGNNEYYEL